MGSVLETHDLSKQFGSLVALDGLDIALAPGEVFGFLGPNGAGKTTTIRLLLDFLRPTRGHASVLGHPPGDPASRARLGYLPADLHLDPRYTAADILDVHAAVRGALDRSWTDALTERFALDPTRPVAELSTGNRRKIGILLAFAHRPELLVLDEPTSGLDPLLQREFLTLVQEVVAEGAAVFLSSHVLPEVEHTAHRVGVLRAGRLVLVATIDELRARAHHHLELRFAEPPPPGTFDGVPGVVAVDEAGDVVHLVVEGSVDATVKTAARFELLRLDAPEADLEDVFLDLYRGEA